MIHSRVMMVNVIATKDAPVLHSHIRSGAMGMAFMQSFSRRLMGEMWGSEDCRGCRSCLAHRLVSL